MMEGLKKVGEQKQRTATRQNKRKWLNRYTELSEELERQTQKAGYWKEKAQGLSVPCLNSYGIPSANRKNMADYIADYLDLAKECTELARHVEDSRQEIMKAIDEVEDQNCRELLRYKYIDGLDFISISKKMHYSMRWIRHLHMKALDELCTPVHS